MGFSNFFSDKKKTDSTSKQTADQQYGLSDEANAYWQSIAGRYQQPWAEVGPNSYQTNAANATPGYAAGLTPAMWQATQIGMQGLDPNSIARFQNPHEQQVVDSTIRGIRDNAAKTGAQQEAAAAKMGALGGTSGINRRLIRDQGTDELIGDTTGRLRQAGFNTASGLAQGSLQAQLAGIQGAGNIANTQAGINNLGFQQGTQLWNQGWQNAVMPYQIGQMGAGTLSGLAGVSGNRTTGTSTGSQTTTGTASPFATLANVGGLGLAAYGAGLFSDERVKEGITPIGETYDGQPIYKYNYKGSPKTQIGLIAQDVEGRVPEAVGSVAGIKTVDYDVATKGAERGKPMSGGGGVAAPKAPDAMEKFTRAFESISGMLQKARGGSVARAGGASGLASGGPVGSWEATVSPAASGMDWKAMGQGMSKLGQSSSSGSSGDGGGDLLAQQQASLSNLMASMTPRRAAGGVAWGDTGPEWEDERPSGLGAPMFVGAGAERVDRRDLPPPPSLARVTSPHGAEISVAAPYAARFKGLLTDLADAGYAVRGDQSGGYNPRHIAGTTKPSQHAHGAAVDINWDRNARGTDGDIPAPLARSLADKHGLTWGGDWKHSDPMHFEVKPGATPQSGPSREDFDSPEGGRLALGIVPAGGASGMDPVARSHTASVRVAAVGAPSDAGPVGRAQAAPANAPEEKSWIQRLLPGSGEGLLAGKPMTGLDRLGIALMKVRGPMFDSATGGVADALLDINKTRIAEAENERAAQRYAQQLQQQKDIALGSIGGQPTLDARRIEADAAERKRAADFARQRELGVVDGQKTLDARRIEADVAERTARQTGRLPDGTLTQQGMLNEQEIAKAKMQREMDELKIADIREPEKIYARRKAIADKYNLKEGTAEYTNWIFDGKIPDRTGANETTTQKEVAKAEVEMAQKAIASGSGAKDVIRIVDQLRALPETKNFENAIGPLDDYKMWQSIAGSIPILSALTNPTTSAEIKRLQSQLELAGGEKMKGLGAQSDKDAERLAAAVSGLSSARNATEYYAALRVIEESVTGAYNRAVEAGKKFPALGGNDFSNATPRRIKPSPHQALTEAREAIRRGASKDAVAAELKKMGIDPGGL